MYLIQTSFLRRCWFSNFSCKFAILHDTVESLTSDRNNVDMFNFCYCFTGEMIDKLTLTYNRTRQAVITNELVEIISGAAAV